MEGRDPEQYMLSMEGEVLTWLGQVSILYNVSCLIESVGISVTNLSYDFYTIHAINLSIKVSRKHGIYVGGKRYRPVNAYGKKSGRPWINGPLGGKEHFTLYNSRIMINE